jgi:hypothetical protein
MPTTSAEENSRCKSYTPLSAGEERDSGKRTMGVPISTPVNEDRLQRKKYSSRFSTPSGGGRIVPWPPRTMGAGQQYRRAGFE